MTLTSNIGGVIRQLETLKRNVPVAAQKALEPSLWQDEARELAERVLAGLATSATAKYIPEFLVQVLPLMGTPGLSLQMSAPQGLVTLAQAQGAKAALSPSDLMNNLFLGQVQEFEDLLVEWVRTEKRKDARDLGKTDEEIAHLISYIMLSPSLGPRGSKARAALAPHIAAYLAKRAAGGLPVATASEWLQAVLAAWRKLVLLKYPEKLRAILREMNDRLL